MKLNRASIIFTVILFTGIFIQAQGPHQNGDMMGDGMRQMGGCGMMTPKVHVTPDGNVIVVTGTKILKYDKDLNLQKEITVPVDTAGVQSMMQQCPMMQQSPKQQQGQ